jgi:hypothetical protein
MGTTVGGVTFGGGGGGGGGVAGDCSGPAMLAAGFGRTVALGATRAVGVCTTREGCEVVCRGGALRRTRGISGA